MHTQNTPGINTKTLEDLLKTFEVTQPSTDSRNFDVDATESTSEEKINEQFEKLEEEMNGIGKEVDLFRGRGIEAAKDFDLEELDRIDAGINPTTLSDEISIHQNAGNQQGRASWSVEALMRA
jgi:hypothetical protein